jgi:N-ethylmaleimide reductase
MTDLFSPLAMGPARLAHRVVMAPLTRMRAGPGNVPTALTAAYYGQRATPGGLIIAEATQVVPEGQGYPNTPGIHSAAQVQGWRGITDAIHARGGIAFLQLWHVGRISDPSHQPGGAKPVGPSAIAAAGNSIAADWSTPAYEAPRALETAEVQALPAAYARGARLALEAGFDGVEIHAANGYLLEQFMQPRANQRSDQYGGSIANRLRLTLEVTEAVAAAIGAERTGIRLSPYGIANDSGVEEPMPLYTPLVEALARFGLAYLHLIEPRAAGAGKGLPEREGQPLNTALFRPLWPGVLMGAGGYTRERALEAVASGTCDLVAFGRHFISTPDIVERLRHDRPLNPYDRSTFYGGDARGYTDQPFWGQ